MNNSKNDILNFIIENDLHSRFTISIIKKLATSGTEKKDGTISFALCDSFLDIVNGGYTDLIIDDLKQEVFIELMSLANDNHISLGKDENNNDVLIFDNYTLDNGQTKSYYINLFHVIRNYMNAQKKHIDRSAICIDLFDENDEEITVSVKNNNYRRLVANSAENHDLENVAMRNDIQLIFGYLKHKYPKHFSLMCKVFELLYTGLTYDEIALKLNITKNKVRYQVALLRSVFDETTLEIKYTHEKTMSLFTDTTRNTCTTYYINREIRKTTTPTVKKDNSIDKVYPSYPLSCGILDTLTKQEIDKAYNERMEAYEKNIRDNSKAMIEVYDKKHKTLNIINENGHVLFAIEAKSLSAKTIKKYKIHTI